MVFRIEAKPYATHWEGTSKKKNVLHLESQFTRIRLRPMRILFGWNIFDIKTNLMHVRPIAVDLLCNIQMIAYLLLFAVRFFKWRQLELTDSNIIQFLFLLLQIAFSCQRIFHKILLFYLVFLFIFEWCYFCLANWNSKPWFIYRISEDRWFKCKKEKKKMSALLTIKTVIIFVTLSCAYKTFVS